MYLEYIDNFTIEIFFYTFLLIVIVSFVFWTGEAFLYFINSVFGLNDFKRKKYD